MNKRMKLKETADQLTHCQLLAMVMTKQQQQQNYGA